MLVVGTDDWAIAQAAGELERAGHCVARCQEPGAPAFPCIGVRDRAACPLERDTQVVLAIRNGSAAHLTPYEMGVVCALHRGLPLVAAGLVNDAPYRDHAAAVVDHHGEPSSACCDAVRSTVSTPAPAPAPAPARNPETEVVHR